MIFKRAKEGALWVVLLMLVATGCSTMRYEESGRRGLLSAWDSKFKVRMRRAPSGALDDSDYEKYQGQMRGWRWPLDRVEITSQFGERDGRPHEGVDLKAFSGTKVYSTQQGEVVYASNKISGYGNMVVVKHTGDIYSVYAHLSKFKVHKNQKIKRGTLVGLSGKTGHVTGPHLHFEVRTGVTPMDPERVIAQADRKLAQRSGGGNRRLAQQR